MNGPDMMNIQKLVLLTLAVVTLGACAKKEESTAIGRDNATMAPTVQWAQSNSIIANGIVTANSSQQSLFQDAVKGYVDGFMLTENVGFVSATASSGTGYYFGAKVELKTGLLNQTSTPRTDIRTDSKLYVEIVDEYTGRLDGSGQKVPSITRGYSSATGYVQGNRAYIEFVDEKKNLVKMDGTFNGSTFIGTFEYDNTFSADGSSTAAGVVGQFQVPTCQFFHCQ